MVYLENRTEFFSQVSGSWKVQDQGICRFDV